MIFAIQVRDWLIRVVRLGINQSQARIIKDIINLEILIYLLHIINIQNMYIVYQKALILTFNIIFLTRDNICELTKNKFKWLILYLNTGFKC